MQVTADLAGWIARSDDPPTHRARRAAQQALLDWAGVCLAGAKDPLVDLLVADAAAQTGLGGGLWSVEQNGFMPTRRHWSWGPHRTSLILTTSTSECVVTLASRFYPRC